MLLQENNLNIWPLYVSSFPGHNDVAETLAASMTLCWVSTPSLSFRVAIIASRIFVLAESKAWILPTRGTPATVLSTVRKLGPSLKHDILLFNAG